MTKYSLVITRTHVERLDALSVLQSCTYLLTPLGVKTKKKVKMKIKSGKDVRGPDRCCNRLFHAKAHYYYDYDYYYYYHHHHYVGTLSNHVIANLLLRLPVKGF